MKRLICFVIVLILLFTSCSSNKVLYSMYGRLRLADGETNSYPVNKIDVNAFDKCCQTESGIIFLNRAIHNNAAGYDIFISVSESMHQNEFDAVQNSDPRSQVLEKKSELVSKIKVNGFLLQNGDSFIARFVYTEIQSGFLVIYDYSSKNEAQVRSCYKEMASYLNEKIKL